jgi:hypothetical protein
MSDPQLPREVRRRLAIIRHAQEVTGNVALTCRYYGISRRRPEAAGKILIALHVKSQWCNSARKSRPLETRTRWANAWSHTVMSLDWRSWSFPACRCLLGSFRSPIAARLLPAVPVGQVVVSLAQLCGTATPVQHGPQPLQVAREFSG